LKTSDRGRIRAFTPSLCSWLSVLIVFCLSVTCYASSPETEYKKIQKEIKAQKKKLEQVKRHESSIISDIEEINSHLRTAENNLRKYKLRLANTEGRIKQVENEMSVSRGAIERHRQWMKRKLRAIYKYGQNADVIILLLSTPDIPQLIRNSKNLHYITAYDHRRMSTYQENLITLREKEKQLTNLKRELISNRENVLAEEASLSGKRSAKETMLASVKKEKSSHTKMLREMEESSKKLLEIIRNSERGEAFAGRGFAALKGTLPWPVQGKVVVPYGSQKDPQFSTPVFRSGTFIESPSDSVARAVYEGKVVFAEWFKGYGQLVIINHGEGYHSLYGSLSEIFTKVGDIIKSKQTVGRVGNSSIVNSPGLYFELRYKGKPLNPIQWLQRR
jgi:murein hydrolase activator